MTSSTHGDGSARDAVAAQADAAFHALQMLDAIDWSRPSVLDGWTVAALGCHIAISLQRITEVTGHPTDERPLSVAEYIAGYAASSAEIADREADTAARLSPADILAEVRTRRDEAKATLEAGIGGDAIFLAPGGPMRYDDYLVTRVLELVVHTDDLGRSVPDQRPPEIDRGALRLVTRLLADILAARAPGRSVELRVPPYVAVQCVEGPRHTRGNPPNVVETDPLTWVRVAAGRLEWTEALQSGALTASGERADLRPYLPLVG